MKRFGDRRGVIVVSVAAIVVAAASMGAYAAANSGSGAGVSSLQQLRTGAPGLGRFARADGLTPSDATPVFTLANGESVGVVENSAAKCLIRSLDGHSDETCATTAEIAEGKGISVGDECGSAGKNLMEITGLAPDGTVSVRMKSSDGTAQTATVVDGTFKFDGTNPAQGAPYPTGVEWVASSGATIGSADLPVQGDDFCLPTS
jgi:hypothetical protein